MSDTGTGRTEAMSRTRKAWGEFGDEFAEIAQRFRTNYDQLAETTEEGSEESRTSIERAVRSIRDAVGDMADSLSDSLHDSKLAEEAEEAGASLVKAFGVTLSDLGQTLQRTAQNLEKDD